MKRQHILLAIVVAVTAGLAPLLRAQSAPPTMVSQEAALTATQALPLTCAQAWIVAQKNYATLRALVVDLAKVSLVNRDMTFPDERDAGIDAGKGIAADCKADPNALLFAVVDKHVRRVAGPIQP